MTKKENFFINYTLVRSKRKTLSFTITREGELIVRTPVFMLRSTIESHIDSKRAWIEKHLERAKNAPRKKIYTKTEKESMQKTLKTYLEKRVYELWQEKNITPYTSLKVTLSERRWGSCSAKNGLCFSYRLAEFFSPPFEGGTWGVPVSDVSEENPPALSGILPSKGGKNFIDAIIIHELAHIVHKNHQKPFWNLVYSWMPEYEEILRNKRKVL